MRKRERERTTLTRQQSTETKEKEKTKHTNKSLEILSSVNAHRQRRLFKNICLLGYVFSVHLGHRRHRCSR